MALFILSFADPILASIIIRYCLWYTIILIYIAKIQFFSYDDTYSRKNPKSGPQTFSGYVSCRDSPCCRKTPKTECIYMEAWNGSAEPEAEKEWCKSGMARRAAGKGRKPYGRGRSKKGKEREGKAEPRAGKLSGPEGGRSREAVGAGRRSELGSGQGRKAAEAGRLSGLEDCRGWKEVRAGRRSGLEGGRGWKAVGGRSQERGEDRKREGKGRSRKQKLWTVKQWTVRSPRSRCGWRRPPARRYSYSPFSRGCWPGACRPCASK